MTYLSASDWVSHKAGNRLLASVAVISRLGSVWGDLLPCPLTRSLTSSCACLLLDWKHQILATWPLYRPIQNMAFFGTKAGVGRDGVEREREREGKIEVKVFYNLILEVTSHHLYMFSALGLNPI